jgi:hypothetical protein
MVKQSLLGFYPLCSLIIRRLPKKPRGSLAMPGNNEAQEKLDACRKQKSVSFASNLTSTGNFYPSPA